MDSRAASTLPFGNDSRLPKFDIQSLTSSLLEEWELEGNGTGFVPKIMCWLGYVGIGLEFGDTGPGKSTLLLLCGNSTLLGCGTSTLLGCGSSTLLVSGTSTLLHCGTGILGLCGWIGTSIC